PSALRLQRHQHHRVDSRRAAVRPARIRDQSSLCRRPARADPGMRGSFVDRRVAHTQARSRPAWRGERACERLGVRDMKTAQPGLKQSRLSIRDKLLLALLPTATVLPMLGVIETFGRHHLLCASKASSAFLIYWDPPE